MDFVKDRLSPPEVAMNRDPSIPFPCELCSKTYSYKKNFERHLQTHCQKKPCCHICEARDTVELLLTRVAEESFICEICCKECSCKKHLERHLRTHEKPHSFVCVKCEKTFCTNSLLNRHLLRMHFCCSKVPHCNH